jgi:hypothetical protein
LIIGLVWFTGSSSRAVSTRHWIAMNSKAVGAAIGQRTQDLRDGELSTWTGTHHHQLRQGLTIANILLGIFAFIAVFTLVSSWWGLLLLIVLAGAWYYVQKRLNAALEVTPPALTSGETSEKSEDAEPVSAISAGDESDATTPQ